MKKICAGILFVFVLLNSFADLSAQIIKHERLLSFEDRQIPSYITGNKSDISVSELHYKDGKSSLQWVFQPGGTLSIHKDLHFEKKDPTGKDLYLSTFVIWVYNENAIDDTVTFEFLKDGRVCTTFPFKINFTGWRAAWVCYERDMKGTPEEGMNQIRIVAPETKGKLFIDHLLTSAKTDPRHQTPDMQVPFVNAATQSHWLVIYKNSFLKPDIALTSVSDGQKKEIALIEERFRSLIHSDGETTDKTVDDICRAYRQYNIQYVDGKVQGTPIFFTRAAEAYERILPDWSGNMINQQGVEVKAYFDLMFRVAVAYNNSSGKEQRGELKQIFVAMYDHITDQGIAYGSCWGNFTHYGYSFRNFYTSYFLMKDVLIETGKLRDAERAMQWYAITNEVYKKPLMPGIDMDSFNTQTTGRIASILIMEDSPEKLQYLRSFSRWINNGCLPAPGLAGSFKKDGGAFHHRNNYPAYAVGGLDGATNMIYLLSRTEFAVSPLAHETVKNVLLTMRFYCNTMNFPLSMSGRHPDGKGKLVPNQYATMAIAGTPDGKQEYDVDMASAYLRLMKDASFGSSKEPDYMPQVASKKEKQMVRLLSEKGFTAESDPQGNIAMGYGCVSVQRRSNWSAVVRGHSRYLWAAEHYLPNNFYGRYLAHGSMQILTADPGKMVTPLSSGWQEAGFDWGRMPGATAIHLPIPELRANVLNVDAHSGFEEMLFSDETFAGGLSHQHQHGNFGMKLHEHDKYNGSHRARKSYHFFDNMIVCLGSDIENTNDKYDTETTIFQLAVTDDKGHSYWDNYNINDKIWMDHLGTGYYVPHKADFEKNFPQLSLGQRTGEETSGDWVSLVVNHGKAPMGASYEYAALPQTAMSILTKFARKPEYKILQQDKNAHIVQYPTKNITSYVLFETPVQLPKGLLLKADTSCLVMIEEKKNEILLTVSQPDLALYRGASDEIYDNQGKRIERSIYSRPWIDNESKEIPVVITLKGYWNIPPSSDCRIVSRNSTQTVLEFTCKDAASFEVVLNK